MRWSRALPSRSESSPLLDRGRTVLRLPERHRLRARRAQRRRAVDLPRRRRGQGQPDALGRQAVLRRLLRPRPGGLRADRPRAVGQRLRRRAARQRHLLLDRRRRLRPRVPRQHRRAHLRLRRRTGKLDWAVQTGAYVYASPAVTNAPGLGPTIYLGSYNGTFYALNARSGAGQLEFKPAGGSPARPRSSAASSISPTSATTEPTAWGSPPAGCSSKSTQAPSTL